jgi:hypothetical protein
LSRPTPRRLTPIRTTAELPFAIRIDPDSATTVRLIEQRLLARRSYPGDYSRIAPVSVSRCVEQDSAVEVGLALTIASRRHGEATLNAARPRGGWAGSPNITPLSAAPILRAANPAYSRSFSAPTKNRPSSLAATPVVPDPQKGSKSRSPSALEARTERRTRRRGFWVGWRPWDFSLMSTVGRRQTEKTWEVGSRLFMRS